MKYTHTQLLTLAAVATGDSPTLQGQSQVLLRDTDCAKGLDCAR